MSTVDPAIRILLADDHDIVRRGLRELIEEHDGWRVQAEASNGREAVELAARLRPHVAILDLSMPELNGLEATRRIRKESPSTEILVFTMHESEEIICEVLAAGARGFLLKSDAPTYVVAAIESLVRRQPFFTGKVSETMLDRFLRAEGAPASTPLTSREREIVQLLAEGRSNKTIAATLGISVKTVETHRATLMRKLGVNSIAGVVRYAIRNHIVEA